MPRNGSGTYTLPESPFVAGTVISSAAVNDDFSDIATALTGSLPRNGEAGMLGQFRATDGSIISPSITFSNDLNTGFYRPGDDTLAVVVGGVQVGLFNSTGLQGVIPIGVILDYGGSTIPSLWILCYGQAVSRTTYALLYAIIGNTFGSGDGLTTFNLPDLRGRAIFGRDDMGGVAASRLTLTYFGSSPIVVGNFGGVQNNTLLTANFPAYTPTGTITNGAITINVPNTLAAYNTVAAGNFTSGTFGNGPAANPTASQAASTFAGAAQGGASTPISNLPPGMILNKIIYAGA